MARRIKLFVFPYSRHRVEMKSFRHAYIPLNLLTNSLSISLSTEPEERERAEGGQRRGQEQGGLEQGGLGQGGQDNHRQQEENQKESKNRLDSKNLLEKSFQWIQKKGIETLKECQESEEGTMKRKIFQIYEKSLSFLDPHELLLSQISANFVTKQKEVVFIYPDCSDEVSIRNDVQKMLSTLKAQNTILLTAYTLMIPITSLATILPGPNIFLAGNLMRIYYLYTCRLSLKRFLSNDDPNILAHTTFLSFPISYQWKATQSTVGAISSSSWESIDQELQSQILSDLRNYQGGATHEGEKLIDNYRKFDPVLR